MSLVAGAVASGADLVVEHHAFNWHAHLPQLRDPGLASLRRAARAAILIPALFAACSWLVPQAQLITFATFGAFALMVLGDFGGSSRHRAAAYAVSTLAGCVIIVGASLAAGTPWTAAVAVGIGAFIIQFVAIFGGYTTAAQLPLVLCLVLAVAIPAPVDQIPLRIVGWLIGGAVALLGGVFAWPRHEHTALHRLAAASCQRMGDLVTAVYAVSPAERDVEDRRQQATKALDELRQAYRVTPHRPASPTRHDRAFAELVDELGRAMKLMPAIPPAAGESSARLRTASQNLTEAIVDVLQSSGRVLERERPAPNLAQLIQVREEHRQALDEWAAEQLRSGTPAQAVLARLDVVRPLKTIAFIALAIGTNATLAAGLELDPRDVRALPVGFETAAGVAAGARRAADTFHTHLRLSSIWFRNCLRAAVGLSIAVLLVDLVGLDHAFWAVLGTLSVLRSNALATGRTALAAVVGTALGILPAGLLLIPLGTQPAVLWTVFPFTVFVAAYAPSVIGFVVGQAAFTLLVVVLFNLIQPVGWTLSLVRLQDVVIGAAVSLVIGALFWPRGARGQLRTALGSLYRRNAAYLRTAFDFLLDRCSEEDCLAARHLAIDESARAGEVFDQFLNDRSAKVLPPGTWGTLQAGGSHLLLVGDSLERLAAHGYRVLACADAAHELSRAAAAVVDELECMGQSLERGVATPPSPGAAVPAASLEQATTECLGNWGGSSDATLQRSALGLVWATDWIQSLRMALDHLSAPSTAAVRLAGLAWWH
ncbi:MAG: FUSC family protein [Chloroflexi bacterium]|nr:FUSC family protein [Chloroflexota bacterium]